MNIDIVMQGFDILNSNLSNFVKAVEELKSDGSIQKRHAFLLETQVELLKETVEQVRGTMNDFNKETREQLVKATNDFTVYSHELQDKIQLLEDELKELQEKQNKRWWKR